MRTAMDAVFKPGGGPDASPPLPKIVVGKKLSRRRKGINPSHLALLAVDLETGRARLSAPLTRRQAIAVTGASAPTSTSRALGSCCATAPITGTRAVRSGLALRPGRLTGLGLVRLGRKANPLL